MSRYSLKGTIGQLIYDGETQIKLPNDAPKSLYEWLDELVYFKIKLRFYLSQIDV
jgi:hypothetical protein